MRKFLFGIVCFGFFCCFASLCFAATGCGKNGNTERENKSENAGSLTPVLMQETTPTVTLTPTPTPTATPTPVLTDYLFVYFTGNAKGQETITMAVSHDALSWKTLNNKKPVITSTLGTGGLRDPFIIRSHDGGKYYLLATDLCIAESGDWWKAQYAGSKSIMIWESEDLVNWSEQRMVKINSDNAGCTWAPEAFYDEENENYIVFFSSRVSDDNYAMQRVYYCTTTDFYEFSDPVLWIGYGYDTIDTTVIKDGDMYYRFTKLEKDSKIILEKCDTLLGNWEEIESESLYSQEGVEGPCCFRFNDDDVIDNQKFGLLLDNYGGSGYYMLTCEDLAGGMFNKKRGYSLPSPAPRHGTVIGITATEYDAIIGK